MSRITIQFSKSIFCASILEAYYYTTQPYGCQAIISIFFFRPIDLTEVKRDLDDLLVTTSGSLAVVTPLFRSSPRVQWTGHN